MLGYRLAIPLLGVLVSVLYMHAGTRASATIHNQPDSPDGLLITRHRTNDDVIAITAKQLNDSIDYCQDVIAMTETLERNLGWANIRVTPGTPSHGLYINSAPSEEALAQAKDSFTAVKVAQYLVSTHCGAEADERACAQQLARYTFYNTPLERACPKTRAPACTENERSAPYRSVDGRCNHERDDLLGSASTSYRRLLFPQYLDGAFEPRRAINRKHSLPNARAISATLCRDRDVIDKELTLAAMQWGQFIEHDLAKTAVNKMLFSGSSIDCCEPRGYPLSPRYMHRFCNPIQIPDNDKLYDQVQCMNYVRSVMAMSPDCTLGPARQLIDGAWINQATHFLDLSQIYGANVRRATRLRSFAHGLLDVSVQNGRHLLPLSRNAIEQCQYATGTDCFFSGDSRVNMHPHTTTMYTVWVREHNRIARALAELNPTWDDETLYQEARRITIAQMQHITYSQWLPLILGNDITAKILAGEYADRRTPSVSNSFATAAIKFTNSLMDGRVRLYDEARRTNATIALSAHTANIFGDAHGMDGLIRGLATQHSQKMDMFVASDLTDSLYTNGKFGLDALTIDIQRGRDHGLPPYTSFRLLCGLKSVSRFEDLHDVMDKKSVNELRKVYDHPHDVDLLIGGMMERPRDGSRVGPTFTCLLRDQMFRTRNDRYFYTNAAQPRPFTHAQLREIKKATLARVFCDNGDRIRRMQPDVFRTPIDRHVAGAAHAHVPYMPDVLFDQNELVDCDGPLIPRVNLNEWKEEER